jgi:hypothetical protein
MAAPMKAMSMIAPNSSSSLLDSDSIARSHPKPEGRFHRTDCHLDDGSPAVPVVSNQSSSEESELVHPVKEKEMFLINYFL